MVRSDLRHVRNEKLREEVWHATLPNGLRVSFCPRRGFQKRYACYSTFYGSVDNAFTGVDGRLVEVPDGIAHFLEHTLFETDEGNVSDLFAMNGAYNNASTSFTTTSYLFASSDRFYDNLELLVRFVESPSFRQDKIDKERGIIEQEITGYDDSPDWTGYRGLLECLFAEHPVRIDIAGTVESIARIDASTLQSCYDRFYCPENMHLFVVGDLDRDELLDFLAERSRPTARARGVFERRYPDEPGAVKARRGAMKMDVALPKLFLGFKDLGVPLSGREFVEAELTAQVALEIVFGRTSDLYRELYGRGLILDDFYSYYGVAGGTGHGLVAGDTPDAKALEAELLAGMESGLARGVGVEEFERERRKMLGGFVRGFNSLEYIASNYTGYLFHGFDLFEVVDVIDGLERDAVVERMRALLEPGACASYVIEPLRDESAD